MWLKVIFVVIVGLFLYRLFGGKIPFIDKPEAPKEGEHDFGKIEATSECAACGVYMTEDDALIYQKKSYCSNDCLEKIK
ncbi:MAG TPA: hypothetical protein EYG94_03735 [Campylobacterales bacterium]|nr:hypothetical protein [Campylobacterales bacterium]